MPITEVGAKGGFIAVTSITNPTVLVTGPTQVSPLRTLVLRSLVLHNVDNAASPEVSVGWDETGATPIVDADTKHIIHKDNVIDDLPLEDVLDNILGSATAKRLYIVSNLANAVTVTWAGYEIEE